VNCILVVGRIAAIDGTKVAVVRTAPLKGAIGKKKVLESTGVEITPEIIEAGVRAFVDFDPRFQNEEECVTAVYRAMQAAARCSPSSSNEEHGRRT
jgi:hypothetical protein